MTLESFVFTSEDLRDAIESSHDAIEKHEESRDSVSTDIKTLEKYLSEFAPKEKFRVGFGRGFVAPENDNTIQASLEYSGSAGGEIHEDALVWMADCKQRFRLHYELSIWDGCIDVDMPGGPLFHDSDTLRRESKPLIECSFDIRKQMVSRLPDFVRSLAEHLRVVSPSENLELDDIPF